ncbi:riboflavin kinase / FMN adenylyltransferase [Dehalogenimonas formicexedens]|uniref:Riboflavin biosynthesis protein n=1 Tax=Dehalogenimonas formicexedens TaxID=1839801 RepID=A0A1P8F735_9CHLR|nr:bifunctional riboflavin kinase/FAD synthetase [Dehalogenimonas formicexedens]APV44296.1 riboflavin kinase / FMN adenylyltransferase [Dehalogenimonas formicexedens]
MTQLEKELAAFRPDRPTALTIGVFDGVHLGHQALITETLRQAKRNDLLPAVVTFAGHPRRVLGKHEELPHLTSLEQRTGLLRETGIDAIIVLTFTKELASVSAEEFLSLLVKRLKLTQLVIGPDFALGKGREGNIESIKTIGARLGFGVTVVPPLLKNGQKVSSTLIRKAMAESDMAKVHDFLGRYFSLEGPVVKGEGRGATIGIPTANIKVPLDQALPADGVYATIACLEGKSMPSITNIGTRPTFGGGHRTIETHLLNFNGDLYGRSLEIAIIEQIRPEKKFSSAAELLSQIAGDIENAKELLKKTGCV